MDKQNIEIKKTKLSDLKRGPIRHKTLSDSFIQRVKNFKQIIAEVDNTSLESTLDNFQRDLNLEQELYLWEHIAKMYQWSVVANAGLSLPQKKELFGLLIGLSLGQTNFSHIKLLSKEVVEEVKDRYQYE
jgi:hypothetical protein